MPIEINVPRLGWSMEEGVFGQWLKSPGELVKPGEMLYILEGDKAAQEIECFDEGHLYIPASAPKPGQPVKVGQMLGWLLKAGEAPPEVESEPATAPAPATAAAASGERFFSDRSLGDLAIGDDSSGNHSSGNEDNGDRRRHRASPRARRAAADRGIDLGDIAGSGAGGRVRERDVLAVQVVAGGSQGEALPHSAMRRLTAQRMIASSQQTAPVTLTTTLDATNLVNLREQFRKQRSEDDDPAPSYTDLIVKLAALSLVEQPQLYAQWREEGMFQPAKIDVAIAVDTAAGLAAPVVRDADKLPLRQLAAAARELIAKARERRLAPSDTQGGAFTVTNLGAYGIDAFTPIVNLPQSAILGVGRIRLAPAVVDGQIVARQQLTLSLTFDHRVVDGAPAARYLQSLVQSLENPAARLIG